MKGMKIANDFQGDTQTSSNDESSHRCALCGQDNVCQSLGYVRYDVPVDHPRFGKLYRCPNFPVEVDASYQERLRKIGNLEAFVDKTFENFHIKDSVHTQSEQHSLEAAYGRVYGFAQKPSGWLVLEGTYGCGKTHLAAAAANERLKHGDKVLFITSPDLLDHLRASYKSDEADGGYDETFERVRTADLLVLDDLGVENPSPWAQEKLFQLLNYRYSHRLPTIITTNQDIDKLDPRVRSRILDLSHTARFTITAPDYRSINTANRTKSLVSSLDLYKEYSFDNFDTETVVTVPERDNLRRIGNLAWNYAHKIKPPWLLLLGPSGSGKTHLAAAVANIWGTHTADVMFITAADLMDYLRETFDREKNVSFTERMQKVRGVPYLIIDDLGADQPSAWVKDRLFQIIDYRYLKRMPTIITSSKKLESLEDRLITRLLDQRVCMQAELDVRSYPLRIRRGSPPTP